MSRVDKQFLRDSLRIEIGSLLSANESISLLRKELEASELNLISNLEGDDQFLIRFFFDSEESDAEEERILNKYLSGNVGKAQLAVLLLTKENFPTYKNAAIEFLTNAVKGANDSLKIFIVLEGVKDLLTSLKFDEMRDLQLTQANLDDLLIDLSIKYPCDHEYTDKPIHTFDLLLNTIQIFSRARKRKQNDFRFDSKKVADNSKSKMLGVEGGLKQVWVNLLAVIPGVSEEKACAIAREFPSFKSLLSSLQNLNSEEERVSLLSGILVRGILDPVDSKRTIGQNIAQKVVVFMMSHGKDTLL